MSQKPRYLSKSRFKIGCECPTKLFYTGKPEYGNTQLNHSFLEALAEGGFQVGALAQADHEGGIEITELEISKAIETTSKLLERENVTLFEPAICLGDLLVRVDVLVKRGNSIDLIEVKAKSFDPSEENPFYNKTALKKGIRRFTSEWEPYLLDIAFQKYVVQNAFPNWKVSAFLMLADQTAKSSVDGLNQRFFLAKDEKSRTRVITRPGTQASDLGAPLLIKIGVDQEIEVAHSATYEHRSFREHVEYLARTYKEDQMAPPLIGSQCKGCEFRIGPKEKSQGLKSGFELCWKEAAQIEPSDLTRPLVFDIWNFRHSQDLMDGRRYFMDQVTESDISPAPRKEGQGLSSSERQWLQVTKVQSQDQAPFLDRDGLASEMKNWIYPLHFIDFETTMVAIPFLDVLPALKGQAACAGGFP
ncbi:MAG: DUF2779 domain-containing protein, partial [Bdellovibrionia bacterium]